MSTEVTAREWLTANHEKYPTKDELIKACVEQTGKARSTVARQLHKAGLKKAFPQELTPGDRTLAFRQKHDKSYIIPRKVKEVIKEWLTQDHIQWSYDTDMQKQCEISNAADWKNYARENPEFDKHILKLHGKPVWARDEKYRDKLQRMALT